MADYNFHSGLPGLAIDKFLLDQAARDRQATLDAQALAHQQEGERIAREENTRNAETHRQALEIQGQQLALDREKLTEQKRASVMGQIQQAVGVGGDLTPYPELLKSAQESVPWMLARTPGTHTQGPQTGVDEHDVPQYEVSQTAPERNVYRGTQEQQKIQSILDSDPELAKNPEVRTMLKVYAANPEKGAAGLYAAIASASRGATDASWQRFTGRRKEAKPGTPDEMFWVNPKTREIMDSTGKPVPEGVNEGAPAPGNPLSGLFVVKGIDEMGNPIETVQKKVEGAVFHTSPGAVVENRIKSAQTVIMQGDQVIAKLKDPQYASRLGPIMGRYNSVLDFIGNPPPEYAELAGAIESIAMANMGVHGFRAMQGVQDLNVSMSRIKTPEALTAYLNGLHSFARDYISINRVEPGATGAAPAGETPYQRYQRLQGSKK